jgi:hypothetical protein
VGGDKKERMLHPIARYLYTFHQFGVCYSVVIVIQNIYQEIGWKSWEHVILIIKSRWTHSWQNLKSLLTTSFWFPLRLQRKNHARFVITTMCVVGIHVLLMLFLFMFYSCYFYSCFTNVISIHVLLMLFLFMFY